MAHSLYVIDVQFLFLMTLENLNVQLHKYICIHMASARWLDRKHNVELHWPTKETNHLIYAQLIDWLIDWLIID